MTENGERKKRSRITDDERLLEWDIKVSAAQEKLNLAQQGRAAFIRSLREKVEKLEALVGAPD